MTDCLTLVPSFQCRCRPSLSCQETCVILSTVINTCWNLRDLFLSVILISSKSSDYYGDWRWIYSRNYWSNKNSIIYSQTQNFVFSITLHLFHVSKIKSRMLFVETLWKLFKEISWICVLFLQFVHEHFRKTSVYLWRSRDECFVG